MNELIETEHENRLTENTDNKQKDNRIQIRHVLPEDGQKIWSLVKNSRVLDLNSAYCYLLLCHHFRNTCLVAETDGELAGFVTAYTLPGDETTLFIWQIGVEHKARGQGIARKLLRELLASAHCKKIHQIQATISPSNTASLALFRSLAQELGTTLKEQAYFEPSLFPGNQHESENLVTIDFSDADGRQKQKNTERLSS